MFEYLHTSCSCPDHGPLKTELAGINCNATFSVHVFSVLFWLDFLGHMFGVHKTSDVNFLHRNLSFLSY